MRFGWRRKTAERAAQDGTRQRECVNYGNIPQLRSNMYAPDVLHTVSSFQLSITGIAIGVGDDRVAFVGIVVMFMVALGHSMRQHKDGVIRFSCGLVMEY